MSEQHHEEAHTGPIKKPKQLLLAVIWQDGKLHDSAELNAKMNKNLQRLVEKL